MHIILAIVIAYSFLNVFETIYYINNGSTYFGADLLGSWLFYLAALVFLIGYMVFRRRNQKKYSRIANETLDTNNLESGKFFYQLPIVKLMDNLPIKVVGENKPQFELYFNSWIHKISFIFDFSGSPPGLKLASDENTIILKSRKWWRYEYNVYFNDKYCGVFTAKKLIKEGGIKKYLNFTFKSKENEYDLINEHLDLTAYIKDGERTILTGERTYFNLAKDEKSGRRGETHEISIDEERDQSEQELLLALYVTALNIRNF
ncbi:hypothetical protein [Salinicoccus roseus]|uniref:hypothetical protein n=1 Tax=Salinicoccus roseus TaxID=45670 RepID=UPI003DA13118